MSDIRFKWNGAGYFFPTEQLSSCSPQWQRWGAILESAKQGDFAPTEQLLDLLLERSDHVLSKACSLLLGDAGNARAIDALIAYSKRRIEERFPLAIDDGLLVSDALAIDGRARSVSPILELFWWNSSAKDATLFALHLSKMLEPDWEKIFRRPEEDDFPAYRSMVLERLAAIELSEDQHALLGQRVGVRDIAKLALHHLGNEDFDQFAQELLRRRFEASTGIDCTHFFRDGRFQPLTAAVTLQEFLASDESKRFVDGKKYFFGWPVD